MNTLKFLPCTAGRVHFLLRSISPSQIHLRFKTEKPSQNHLNIYKVDLLNQKNLLKTISTYTRWTFSIRKTFSAPSQISLIR